ncbi:MAG: AbrB/MazE/SpoVT family DNA-binding domain-containing protein [Azospirillaceae bacterium]|nr:AbrB/MazE/SpoVT family DNA-binding domain-containing protein [Azospirillaceae bacterium]
MQLARWGNSLGVRIPKEIAGRLGLIEGVRVEMTTDDGRIVISPVTPRYQLADLLQGITPEAMRDAFDWGDDLGRERIDE